MWVSLAWIFALAIHFHMTLEKPDKYFVGIAHLDLRLTGSNEFAEPGNRIDVTIAYRSHRDNRPVECLWHRYEPESKFWEVTEDWFIWKFGNAPYFESALFRSETYARPEKINMPMMTTSMRRPSSLYEFFRVKPKVWRPVMWRASLKMRSIRMMRKILTGAI